MSEGKKCALRKHLKTGGICYEPRTTPIRPEPDSHLLTWRLDVLWCLVILFGDPTLSFLWWPLDTGNPLIHLRYSYCLKFTTFHSLAYSHHPSFGPLPLTQLVLQLKKMRLFHPQPSFAGVAASCKFFYETVGGVCKCKNGAGLCHFVSGGLPPSFSVMFML